MNPAFRKGDVSTLIENDLLTLQHTPDGPRLVRDDISEKVWMHLDVGTRVRVFTRQGLGADDQETALICRLGESCPSDPNDVAVCFLKSHDVQALSSMPEGIRFMFRAFAPADVVNGKRPLPISSGGEMSRAA